MQKTSAETIHQECLEKKILGEGRAGVKCEHNNF